MFILGNLCFVLQSVSKAEKVVIINKHNELRSDPKTTETAEAMCKVVCNHTVLCGSEMKNASIENSVNTVINIQINLSSNMLWQSSRETATCNSLQASLLLLIWDILWADYVAYLFCIIDLLKYFPKFQELFYNWNPPDFVIEIGCS